MPRPPRGVCGSQYHRSWRQVAHRPGGRADESPVNPTDRAQADSASIRWPSRYAPGQAPVHVRNELEIDAAPDAVWAWLIRARRWPEWYENSSDVRIQSGASPDLDASSAFTWKTFGVRLESTVMEFVPGERIAWNALGVGVDAYHAWLVRPTPRGVYVLTEE